MQTIKLNEKIAELAKKNGIEKYRIEGIKLVHGDYSITDQGELAWDTFINVVILPIKGYFQIPITFSIKNE